MTILKSLLLLAMLAYVVHVVRQQPFSIEQVWARVQGVRQTPAWWLLLGFLMPVNWGLEALKWQWLLRPVHPQITYRSALAGVLAGVSMGFVLPAQLGDTAGRLLSLRAVRRGPAVGAALLSGGLQFYVALGFGVLAWAGHLALVPSRRTAAAYTLLVCLSAMVVAGPLLWFQRVEVLRGLSRWQRLQRWSAYWQVLPTYRTADMARTMAVAALRYVVFSFQFYAAFRVAGLGLSASVALTSIGLVFLVKTISPAFNLLSDLGIREAAALWVLAPFGLPTESVLVATLTLWLVNVLLPVLAGLFSMAKGRIE